MIKSLPTRPPVECAFITGSKRTMKITFVSPTCQRVETLVNCSAEQYMRWYNNEGHVQDIFPLLDADMRELFISGMGPAEWNKLFGEETC